jgi:hypothetical protein
MYNPKPLENARYASYLLMGGRMMIRGDLADTQYISYQSWEIYKERYL